MCGHSGKARGRAQALVHGRAGKPASGSEHGSRAFMNGKNADPSVHGYDRDDSEEGKKSD